MTTALELATYLDDVLDVGNVPDYSNALNGLQLANQAQAIRRIAAAVDFSSQTIRGAITADANLLLVHHGMFWGGLQPLRGPAYARLKLLIDHDIAVYAAHLPLDRHPSYGNNALLAAELGLVPSAEFAKFKSIYIGVRGHAHMQTTALIDKARVFAQRHGGEVRTTPVSPEQMTRVWAICTGGGASVETLREASELGIDTLIVGEGPHYTAVDATELGITVIYAGHYATETLGVCALSQHVEAQFGIPWTFVEAPTGL
jgi:dinuclear metal center YbgI/SA1388 family protein